MKIKKTVTDKVIAANRANSRKSPGPNTGAGKRRAQMNSLKHGFFARELQITEEDRSEYEILNEELLQQYAPATPMQQIGFEKIVCCCWRCKLALRMESRAVALQQSSNQEPKVDAAGGDTNQMARWYGADYRSLQAGLRFLRILRADVADSGLLHLQHDGPLKDDLIRGFGTGLYNRLMEWQGMSTTAIGFAVHMAEMQERFKGKLPPIDFSRRDREYSAEERVGSKSPVVDGFPGDPERPLTGRATFPMAVPPIDLPPVNPQDGAPPRVVPDPKLQQQMVVKIVDAQIEHLETLVQTRRQDFRETPQALAEFSPRYFADASRDLERAVDWFLKLKEKGL